MLCSPKHWLVPPLFHPPPPHSFLFSAHYILASDLLNTFLNDSYCVSSKKPRVVDFPRLMWHLWVCNRVEGQRWGPRAQWWFVWGTAGKGSRIRMWRTLAVSRLIQDHWFPASFFLPPGHDLHCKWQFCRIGLFLESEKIGGWEEERSDGAGRSGFPQHTGPLDSIPSHPSPEEKRERKKRKTLRCTPPPRVLALVPGSQHSCLPSLPGLLLTTEESTTRPLFCKEEAWTALLLLGVLSPLTSPIRSKGGSAQTECRKLVLCCF